MSASLAKNIVSSLTLQPARMVVGLWSKRDLIWQFTHRNIELRHRGSRLGAFWALINPLSMWALYYFIFGRIYETKFGHIPGETELDFSIALFFSLSLFHLFTETLAISPSLITSNPNFVKKVVFPLEVMPVAQLGAALFHMGAGLTLALVGSLFGTTGLSWQVLWLPVFVLPLVLLSLGVSYFLAALGVFLRDIGQLTAFVSTLLLFSSAVMYPLSKIPLGFEWLRFNPFLQIVDLARMSVLAHQTPSMEWLGYVYAVGAAVFVGGAVFFSLLRKSFAEVI
ncbi:MAG: ABC transporter permease [Verrucomicrobiota bacterium]